MNDAKNLSFVNLLKEYKVLLNKSQLPEIKAQKAEAIKEFERRCESELNLSLKGQNLLKKIHSIKRDVKKKADITRTGNFIFELFIVFTDSNTSQYNNNTGNRRIVLKEHEKVMLQLLEGDDNPAICALSNGISTGFGEDQPTSGSFVRYNAIERLWLLQKYLYLYNRYNRMRR